MRYSVLIILFSLISCASSKNDEKSASKKKAAIYYNQGTNEIVSREYTTALKYLIQANALDPNNSKIQNNLGMAYFFKKKPQTAIRYIRKSINTDPKNTDARLNLATILVSLKNYNEAKKQYDIILDDLTFEKQFKTYYNLGVLHQKQGKEREALNFYKQSLNENADYCPAHFKLGNIHFDNNRYNESLKAYKLAGRGTCYNNPGPIYRQALSLIKLKEYDTAKMKLEEVVERFSLTKYQGMANKQLKNLDEQLNRLERSSNFSGSNGNIFTPDF
jgi:Tfp pilus assembly protein PilF